MTSLIVTMSDLSLPFSMQNATQASCNFLFWSLWYDLHRNNPGSTDPKVELTSDCAIWTSDLRTNIRSWKHTFVSLIIHLCCYYMHMWTYNSCLVRHLVQFTYMHHAMWSDFERRPLYQEGPRFPMDADRINNRVHVGVRELIVVETAWVVSFIFAQANTHELLLVLH